MGEFLTSLAQGAAKLDHDIRAKLKQDPGTLGRMASTVLFDTTPMDERNEGTTNAIESKVGGAMTRRDFLKLAGIAAGGAFVIKASEFLTACTTAPEAPVVTPETPTVPLSPTLTPAIRPSMVPSSEVAKQLTGMLITENPSFPALVKDFDTWSSQQSKNVTPSDAKAFGFLIENYRSTGDKTKDNVLFPYVVSTGRVGADGKPASADFYAWEGNKEFAKLTGRAVDFLKSPEQISGVLFGFQGTVIVWERNGEKGNVDFWTEPNGTYVMYITPDGRNVKVDLPKDGKIAGLALLAKPTEVPPTQAKEPTATAVPESTALQDFEKLGIVFPDRLQAESNKDGLKTKVVLSQELMKNTGISNIFISSERLDKIGKHILGVILYGNSNGFSTTDLKNSDRIVDIASDQLSRGSLIIKLTQSGGNQEIKGLVTSLLLTNVTLKEYDLIAQKFGREKTAFVEYSGIYQGAQYKLIAIQNGNELQIIQAGNFTGGSLPSGAKLGVYFEAYNGPTQRNATEKLLDFAYTFFNIERWLLKMTPRAADTSVMDVNPILTQMDPPVCLWYVQGGRLNGCDDAATKLFSPKTP